MSTAIANVPEAELPDRYEVVNGQVVEIAPRSRLFRRSRQPRP